MTATVAGQVASSSGSLVVRRVSVLVTTAVSTAVIARALDTGDYGALQTSLAVWTIALTVCEFGFGAVLSREFARRPADRAQLLRTARDLQGALGLLVAGGLVVTGLVLGADGQHGRLYLALAPSVAVAGFSGGRSLFLATFTTGRLVRIDVSVAVGQLVAVAAAAVLTRDAVVIAAVTSAAVLVNTVWVGLAASRVVGPAARRPATYRPLLRQVVPLGATSIVSRVYLSIDLVILGALASDTQVAYYAGAVKIMMFLNTLTGLIVAAALPGLAALRDRPDAMLDLVGRLFSWVAVTVLPACALCIVFAPTACAIVLGAKFTDAAGLLIVLIVAGLVSTASQIFGTLLTAVEVVRPMLYQNLIAATVNVVGNLALIPHFGAWACAALTVATECIVCGGSWWSLSRRLDLRTPLAVTLRPLCALGVAVGVAVPLADRPWAGIPLAGVAFLLAVAALRCWPPEFPLQRLMNRPR